VSLHLVTDLPTDPATAIGVAAVEVDEMINGWNAYQKRRGLMPTTIEKRASMVALFSLWFGRDLRLAQREDIERFLSERRVAGRPISDRTRYTWISCLGCFYTWAMREGLCEHDPTFLVERPRLRLPLPRPISDGDLDIAIRGAHGHLRLWMLLGSYGGLRCAEIAGIYRDDILTDLGLLRVLGKGSKERLVPMHPLVSDALRAWPTPRSTLPIFLRSDGAPYTPGQVSRIGRRHLHDLGIEATMHQLRHWFGTRTLMACDNLRTVQELMGHADPKTTAIYTAFCNESGRAAVHALSLSPSCAA